MQGCLWQTQKKALQNGYEVLTASVLIMVVFMIASLSFNNVFSNQIKRDHSAIQNRVKQLEYLLIHDKIKLPYAEDFDTWEIIIIKEGDAAMVSYTRNSLEHKKTLVIQ